MKQINSVGGSVQKKQPLMSRNEAAQYLNISSNTLAQWASRGEPNIPFFKLGKKVCYAQSDLDAFLESNRVDGPTGSFRSGSSV